MSKPESRFVRREIEEKEPEVLEKFETPKNPKMEEKKIVPTIPEDDGDLSDTSILSEGNYMLDYFG